jgi:hypothetical protein
MPDARHRKRPWSAPCAYSDALPVLYCVTLCIWCLRHSLPLQNARLFFGMFTCEQQRHTMSASAPTGSSVQSVLLQTEPFCLEDHVPFGWVSKDKNGYVELARMLVTHPPQFPACTPCASLMPASSP